MALLTFTVAAVGLVLLPGPDSMLVLRTMLLHGRRQAVLTGTGIVVGLMVWATAATLGLVGLLRASERAYLALRVVGALYLCWLGVQALVGLWRTRHHDDPDAPAGAGALAGVAAARRTGSPGLLTGMLTNLLNPKVGVFFVTILPSFVPAGPHTTAVVVLFCAIDIALTVAYFAAMVAAGSHVARAMGRRRVRRTVDAVTGAVLVLFGLRLALEP